MEQDLVDRFEVSQSTVSRITNTWINFMYLQLKQIRLWPPKEIIKSFMPHVFKNQYPSTRVIIKRKTQSSAKELIETRQIAYFMYSC